MSGLLLLLSLKVIVDLKVLRIFKLCKNNWNLKEEQTVEELRFCRKWFSGVLQVSFYVNIQKVGIMWNLSHFLLGSGSASFQIFKKRGLGRISILREGLLGKKGWTFSRRSYSFYIKTNINLKYSVTQKVYTQKVFLCHK